MTILWCLRLLLIVAKPPNAMGGVTVLEFVDDSELNLIMTYISYLFDLLLSKFNALSFIENWFTVTFYEGLSMVTVDSSVL